MSATGTVRVGRLLDLGPDGLGFVREVTPPHDTWPIRLTQLAPAFTLNELTAWHGAEVRFRLNAQGAIQGLTMMPTKTRAAGA